MKLLNLVPVISQELADEVSKVMEGSQSPGNTLETTMLDFGTESIEGEYDEILAGAGILAKCEQIKDDGYEGIFVNCFGDPGVRAVREYLGIPAFGGFEPAIMLAMGLADRITAITVLKNVVPMLRANAEKAGWWGTRVSSIRYVDIPVLDLDGAGNLTTAIAEEAKDAIETEGAEAVVLGCTGMAGAAEEVHEKLLAYGYDVPVIDPTLAAIKLLEVYGSMGLKPSRLTYMPIRDKKRTR